MVGAVQNSALNRQGIVDICGATELKEELDLYTCPRTGAVTKYFKVATDRGISWEEATRLLAEQRDSAESGFYRATYQAAANKEIFVLALRKASLAAASAVSSSFFHLVRPNTGFSPIETHRPHRTCSFHVADAGR